MNSSPELCVHRVAVDAGTGEHFLTVTQSQSLSLVPCPSGFHGNKLGDCTCECVGERMVCLLTQRVCVRERQIAYGSNSMCMNVS